jgi:hypothetical protein
VIRLKCNLHKTVPRGLYVTCSLKEYYVVSIDASLEMKSNALISILFSVFLFNIIRNANSNFIFFLSISVLISLGIELLMSLRLRKSYP